ncbi:unnamed protein product [Nezara viridula]|uniref:G-protein coupled receptors family 1 profile domain-containing protein n=1 Tax=Nezara viridula TaxID=85310 RepID=A0A9P0EDM1_NEZVI|nr:unnamed protein product [Nezara viridula]
MRACCFFVLGSNLVNPWISDIRVNHGPLSAAPRPKRNVFVIAAILLERSLQSVANYLIVSLAVADLMVACLVMPLGAVYEVTPLC